MAATYELAGQVVAHGTPSGSRTSAGSVAGLSLRDVTKELGGRAVVTGLQLDVDPGELLCFLGPSGCGKTTTLRIIGGFLQPDRGEILIGGVPYVGVGPDRRPTAMVFQNYALWPHMTVFKNVAFGLRQRKVPKPEIRRRVGEVLEMVRLSQYADSFPAQISGGEQQRVALARALVLEPEVLLLDEPLSNLDAKLRVKVREDIRELQRALRITTVFVTHDQDEALAISDRIAVMTDGCIEQCADAESLYKRPATRFVADFIGTMNLLRGRIANGVLTLPGAGRMPLAGDCVPGEVEIAVRPEDVQISSDPGVAGDTGVTARLRNQALLGHYRELTLEIGQQQVRAYVHGDYSCPSEVGIRFSRVLQYVDGRLHAVLDGGRAP
jgi:putative spermidine/putrescine transport system ATP-binding protein